MKPMNSHETIEFIEAQVNRGVSQDSSHMKQGVDQPTYLKLCGGVHFGERMQKMLITLKRNLAEGDENE